MELKPNSKPDIVAIPVIVRSVEQNKRGTWSGKLDFLMSCIGYAAGLGNVWRFPAMAGKNGGGAFLIPFFIMFFLVGIPLFLIEISLGQFSSQGPIKVWRAVPLAQGIGYGMIFITIIVNLYYNVILTWVLYYLFASMQRVLPWTDCDKPWNSDNCFSIKDYSRSLDCKAKGGVYFKHECRLSNISYYDALINKTQRVSPSEEFFNNKMLQPTGSIEIFGGINWHLVLTLLLAWIIVYLILIRGIKSSGKVVYFTATFPYVVLLILVIKGAMLEGAIDGIKFYLYPDWNRLYDLQVWTDAAGQIFFSLSCALGGLIALSSYNEFHNNIIRDTWIVTLINTFTSLFAGFAIFCIIGHMSLVKNIPVASIAASGTGLAFVAYPEALLYLPFPPLWSIIFFFMLILLGIDSQFAGVETVCTVVADKFNLHNLSKWKKSGITGLICLIHFVITIPLVSRSGIYWVELLSSFATNWGLIFIAFMEGIAISYIYGVKAFVQDIEMMIGTRSKRVWYYWMTLWFILPFMMGLLFVLSWFNLKPMMYATYVYPPWANTLGWLIAAVPLILLPLIFLLNYRALKNRKERTFYQNLIILSQPRESWGPALNENRFGRYKPLGEKNELRAVQKF